MAGRLCTPVDRQDGALRIGIARSGAMSAEPSINRTPEAANGNR